MIQSKIDKIGVIVRGLDPVPEPEPVRPAICCGDLASTFEERFGELRAPGDSEPAVLHVRDMRAAAERLRELCDGVAPGEIVWEGDKPDVPRDLMLGITSASFLIAATGSVIIECANRDATRPSLLVDRHIVIASRSQLLPDLPTFYDHLAQRHGAGEEIGNQVCITGCSRTADIEKLLVIPAHGPRQIRVILCDEDVEWGLLREDYSGFAE